LHGEGLRLLLLLLSALALSVLLLADGVVWVRPRLRLLWLLLLLVAAAAAAAAVSARVRVCLCVRACVRACVRVRACVCVLVCNHQVKVHPPVPRPVPHLHEGTQVRLISTNGSSSASAGDSAEEERLQGTVHEPEDFAGRVAVKLTTVPNTHVVAHCVRWDVTHQHRLTRRLPAAAYLCMHVGGAAYLREA
jgi:hypothetical protein